MKFSELVESGATEAKRQDYLAEGAQTPVTLRVSKNLKDAAAGEARLRGISFFAFIRTCIINELTTR